MSMDMDLFETRDCPLCGGRETEVAHRLRETLRYRNVDESLEYTVVRCPVCGLLYVNPRLREEVLAAVYADDLYANWATRPGHVPEVNLRYDIYHHNLDERLAAYRHFCSRLAVHKVAGSAFEVGAGFGYLLKTLREHGFTVSGVELSHYAAGFARERFDLNVRQGNFLAGDFGEEAHDLVVLWHVFEHLHRPNRTLAKCARMLRPGGTMMITVPFHETFTVEKINPVEHLYYFSKEHVARFMEKHMLCETWVDGGFVFARKTGEEA